MSTICNICYTKLFEAFRFKLICIDTEDSILPHLNSKNGAPIDLKDIYLIKEGKEPLRSVLEAERICRLCMQIVCSGFTSVKDIEFDAIRMYIPEVNFNATEEPVICRTCLESLTKHTSFLRNCLGAQKFEIFCEDVAMESQNDIKTEEIDIKTEEIYIKTEEVDIKTDEIEIKSEESIEATKTLPPAEEPSVGKDKDKDSLLETGDYKCSTCAYRTRIKRYLIRHELRHKKVCEASTLKCDMCDFVTKRKSDLASHQLIFVHDIMLSLLVRPFSKRSEIEKRQILSRRPTPEITTSFKESIGGREHSHTFETSWYATYPWLCGSMCKERLYCWPCILMGTMKSSWCSQEGFKNLKNISCSAKMHEGSKDHMQNFMALTRLQQNMATIEDALKENTSLNKVLYNENVRKNRLLICYLIDMTVMFGRQGPELAFQGHDETSNQGNFKEIFKCLIKRNQELSVHCEKFSNIFTEQFETIQNKLIFCVHEYLSDSILNKINDEQCFFFGVIVDDTTDITERSQCSVTLRYVTNGRLQEICLGFFDVNENRTANVVYELLVNVLEMYNFREKLVAQCYDGASVMPCELNELQVNVKAFAPLALFTHCRAHPLNLVLQQGTKQMDKSRIFFSTLLSIPTYFLQSQKRASILDAIVGKRIAHSSETPWYTRSKILSLVAKEWDNLILVFETIIKDTTSGLESINGAKGFLKHFEDFEFAIFTKIYHEIFSCTDMLSQTLETKHLDLIYCSKEIKVAAEKILALRNDAKFKEFFNYAKDITGLPSEPGKNCDESEIFSSYKELYYEIIDCVFLQLNIRCGNLHNLNFLALADSSKFPQYAIEFPEVSFDCLIQTYPNVFKIDRLRNELTILYTDEEFCNLDVQKMVEILYKDYKMIYSETYKLFCLVLTIPATSVSVERSFSCLNRIKTYFRNTMSQKRLLSLSIMAVEEELQQNVSADPQFYEDVINRFVNLKDRPIGIDLIYKK